MGRRPFSFGGMSTPRALALSIPSGSSEYRHEKGAAIRRGRASRLVLAAGRRSQKLKVEAFLVFSRCHHIRGLTRNRLDLL